MKGDHHGRAVAGMLGILVLLAVCLGAGTAVNAAVMLPGFQLPDISESFQQELEGLGLLLEDLANDPLVEDVNPNGGLTTGGTEVVITGTQFTGATKVSFGGTESGDFTVDSDSQITATAPAHAAGTVQVQVTTPGGVSPDTSVDDYTYVEPPATTAAPTTAAPTTAPPTTAAPTTIMVTTSLAPVEGEGGGLSGGWIAFIAVIAVVAVAALSTMVYMLGKRSSKGGPTA